MTTQQVADKLVGLCRQNKYMEATDLYANDIVSIEAVARPGESRETKGLAAVKAKSEAFSKNFEVHSASVEGPLVAGPYFTVTFKLDATFKPEGKRQQMHEIAVYKVADGKIVSEEFFYSM